MFRTLLQKAVKVFASQVERNSLFEKPGEREATPPLGTPNGKAGGKAGGTDKEDGESQ